MMQRDTIDIDLLRRETTWGRAEYHRRLDSTSDRARQIAAADPAAAQAIVIADSQSAGRGRGANRWWTPMGSLALSLLVDPSHYGCSVPARWPISLATAAAVIEAVRPFLPGCHLGLHWPNDVFAAGRKLAGILVESLADSRQIVGIGINVNNSARDAPPPLQEVATSFIDLTGQEHDRTRLAAAVVDRFDHMAGRLAVDPVSLGEMFDRLCLQKGHRLRLDTGSEHVAGRCLGIAADGALLLETDRGTAPFHSGVLLPPG